MPSVIIPACNESDVIGRCISALLGGAQPGEIEVIIVCNGCSDDTANAARRIGGNRVTVVETPVGSKIHALNLGDSVASRFPRFYVDADVVTTLDTIRRLAAALELGTLAAAPRACIEAGHSSWAVRAFYRINDRLPSSREGIGGSGVYGLSESGRRRFDSFPNLIADDGFVRLQFETGERTTLQDCYSTVFAPRTVRELIRIKTRSHFGTAQLRQMFPDRWSNRGESNKRALLKLFANPLLWPSLLIYTCVKLAARSAAKRKLAAHDLSWERDDSSRRSDDEAPAPAPMTALSASA
jgi:glycosyltransferase involved in cell wall biosynthesis